MAGYPCPPHFGPPQTALKIAPGDFLFKLTLSPGFDEPRQNLLQ
ncbi:hypothetical protein ABRZ24_17585 [Brenneria populi]|uniref:Uncharacterized protein n=1 Tax=Brenneria populi TaxID=1505588 RepID=A0ABU6JUF4_9GAMM|nr:hypothetical protein [Brenneria populi Li et al. 2015]